MRRSLVGRAARVVAVASLALAAAACGSTSSPAPASTGPSASGGTSSPVASSSPDAAASTSPDASLLPTLSRVADLEAMLPKKIGDLPLSPRSLIGTDVLATGDAASIAALDAILSATGAKAEDYQFAWSTIGTGAGGSGQDSAVGVFRVKGADPIKVRDTLIAQGTESSAGVGAAEDGTIGGKQVRILRVTAQDGTLWSWYYWPKGDVLFYVQTTDPTIAEQVLAAL